MPGPQLPPRFPREPWSGSFIAPAQLAASVAALRVEQVTSMKFDVRPSVGMVAKDIRRLGMDIRSFREPLKRAIRLVLIPSIKQNFKEEGRPKWSQLTDQTAKLRGGNYHPILHVSGTLEKRATQERTWSIGLTSATIRRLPADAYYGVFHQAGVGVIESGWRRLSKHAAGSREAEALIAQFIPKAAAELGPNAAASHIHNRAVGMLIDSGRDYAMPARPFIGYQPADVDKISAIFLEWMTERAIAVGRFRPEANTGGPIPPNLGGLL